MVMHHASSQTSVLRYEVMIHEFDPYFNYRCVALLLLPLLPPPTHTTSRSTVQLVENGWYEFWNWFDYESWYPLGRVVGGTVRLQIHTGNRFLGFRV